MKYDLIGTEHGPQIEPHYCREWDGEKGCYGTNEYHGYTWDEVVEAYRSAMDRFAEQQVVAAAVKHSEEVPPEVLIEMQPCPECNCLRESPEQEG